MQILHKNIITQINQISNHSMNGTQQLPPLSTIILHYRIMQVTATTATTSFILSHQHFQSFRSFGPGKILRCTTFGKCGPVRCASFNVKSVLNGAGGGGLGGAGDNGDSFRFQRPDGDSQYTRRTMDGYDDYVDVDTMNIEDDDDDFDDLDYDVHDEDDKNIGSDVSDDEEGDVDLSKITPEMDALLCSGNAPEEVIIAQNRLLFPNDDAFTFLDGTVELTVDLPLGAILEEIPSGEVFVDELVSGGNAEKSGTLKEGDIIVAMSLPYGSHLIPVPKENGLETLEDAIKSREQPDITFAVRRGEGVMDIERLRELAMEEEEKEGPSQEMLDKIRELASTEWYPFVPEGDEDEEEEEGEGAAERKGAKQLQQLEELGFDMSADVGYVPSAEEIEKADREDEQQDEFWDLGEQGGIAKKLRRSVQVGDEDLEGEFEEDDVELQEAAQYWKDLYVRERERNKSENS